MTYHQFSSSAAALELCTLNKSGLTSSQQHRDGGIIRPEVLPQVEPVQLQPGGLPGRDEGVWGHDRRHPGHRGQRPLPRPQGRLGCGQQLLQVSAVHVIK